jgi:hypothetical protein
MVIARKTVLRMAGLVQVLGAKTSRMIVDNQCVTICHQQDQSYCDIRWATQLSDPWCQATMTSSIKL